MDDNLYLDNKDIKKCSSFKNRLIGMSFKKKPSNYIYLFPKCNSIHTFFMFKNIDIIMTDKDNNIIKTYINLKPWKVILPQKKVYNVYEFDHSKLKNIDNKKQIIIK